jgi:hypothetical protein
MPTDAMQRRLGNLKRWPRGVSGNPSGLAKPAVTRAEIAKVEAKAEKLRVVRDVREAAKLLTGKAMKTLEDALDDPDCPWPTKVTAAAHILDRGWGKPKEHVQADVKLDLEWLINRGRELRQERERQLLIEGDKTA